jgi:adenosylcobinamide-GDP ribazoletransferase
VIGLSSVFFPLVGAIMGLVLVVVHHAAALLWHDRLVSAVFAVTTLVILSGGLHLDGLMDVCDGAFAAQNREEALKIMKDSRIGAFGALGAFSVLLLKVSLLASLSEPLRTPVLLLMPAVGRWVCVWVICQFPSALQSGMGKMFKQEVTGRHCLWATLVVAIIAGALLSWRAIFLMLFVCLVAYLVALQLSRRFGGLTGDCYGAICEVSEVLVLAAAPIVLRIG